MRPLYGLFVLTGSLVVGSFTGAIAQTSSSAVPGWYVAAGAAYHRYAQPETVHTKGTASPYELQPVQILVGRQFANGYGLEAGFMQAQRAASANSDPVYTDSGDYYYYSTEAVQAFAVSMLLRKSLLPVTASRWQLDGRAGLTYVMTRFTEKYYNVLALNPTTTIPYSGRQRKLGDLPVTIGLAASYHISPRLALTADASAHISWVLCIARVFGTSGSPVGGGGGIGVRYSL
ncbi:hypothetical protein [Hymenobacter negativus]|uniref:Outer membrane protein beta-barrel domain-containing protein n=1 Tax=Hymenobacter negativus TaxID=2795026 RepID=A0ABS3QCB8_9BACT|nr:hypothetical protein [Hymenobacter negativus]MBO2008891.1 hypothetical protein [Hymenobacter negativus]